MKIQKISPKEIWLLIPHVETGALVGRRNFLRTAAAGGCALAVTSLFAKPGLFAEALTQTATIGEGPFYPDKFPLDTDNDLLIINDSITPAVGEISYLSGRVLSRAGEPVRNAFVEIWQVDSHASYIHTGGRNTAGYDGNFQGYGRFMTDSGGRYYFRTIKPVPYGMGGVSRTPHVHFAISKNGRRILTTQMLIRGHEMNNSDFLFRSVRDTKLRESVLVDFEPLEGSKLGELTVNFDIVLGKTLQEMEDGTFRGTIG
jgi:protocatechuate 3,4-dioxygenase beta subunit